MKRFLIAGNWKMHCGPAETRQLLQGLKKHLPKDIENIDILACPPAISLTTAAELLDNSEIMLGAQNVYYEDNGAFTGEISIDMLSEVGCEYVITGHSERRQYFGETDATVNAKVKKITDAGMKSIICVGESLAQRKKEVHKKMVKKQVEAALNGVRDNVVSNIIIAYEPLWAIGTGETASPEQAQEMHGIIREVLTKKYDEDLAGQIRILYGGSMKPHNAEKLLQQPDIDGGLIGGASLKAESFAGIIKIAENI